MGRVHVARDRHPGLAWPAAPALADAACRAPDVNPSWFFPGRGEPIERAKAVCARCPDLDACRGWALEVGSSYLQGIWGGTSERERTLLRRARALELRSAAVYDEPMTDLAVDLAEPAANGHRAPNLEMHGSPETEELHLCQGCGRPIDGHGNRRWCSPACRARTRRGDARRTPVVPQEAPKPASVDVESRFLPTPPGGSETRHAVTDLAPLPRGEVFEALASLAVSLPRGWTVEMQAGAISCIWSP
jgi:WhiB family redox-sensing transcriptional regulator